MQRRHRAILLVALVVTVLSAVLAAQLQVDSDLRRLLPRAHPVVQNLERIEETFGSTGSVNIVIKGGSADARHAFTEALAARFEGHASLRDVDYQLPSDFFTEHALYYLTEAELEELDERIQAWLHYEFCSSARQTCVTDPDATAREKLEAFVDAKRAEAEARTGFASFYEREGIAANVMLLHPTQAAASLSFTREVTREVRAITAEVHAEAGTPWVREGVAYNLVGPYVNKADEQEIIRRDTRRGVAFAFAGVVLILFLLFRSWRVVCLLMVPLCCGVLWSLAATFVIIGDLNTMTSLISTVLMGAGIDGGIHFYVEARRQRRKVGDADAVRLAFGRLIIPLLVASGTTVGAFIIMATSEFPAFREFGIIAAMGVGLCLLAMVTVLPALASFVGIHARPRTPTRAETLPARLLLTRPGVPLLVVVVICGLAALGAKHVGFEFDGRALQSDYTYERTHEDTRLISEIFGQDIHAGLLLRPNLEETRATIAHAREQRQTYVDQGTSVVAELFAVTDLLPDPSIEPARRRARMDVLLEEDELARLEQIAGVKSELRRKKMRADGAEEDDFADEDFEDEDSAPESGASANRKDGLSPDDARLLLAMLDAAPVTVERLPPSILRRVRGDDGSYGIFAYPAFDAADMRKGVEFIAETRSYLPSASNDMFVGETTVYAAMFLMLRQEAPVVLGLAAALIAVLVYWQMRSLRETAMTLLPLLLGCLWLVGLMGVTGIRFTLFNLPILPAILGIGVDNGVYLTDRIRKTRGDVDGLQRSLEETGGAIMAAMATTAIGFAAFMVADSAGVRGIGLVAMLGIVLAALAATMVLPALAGFGRAVAQRRRRYVP